jgi:hypothetical protein
MNDIVLATPTGQPASVSQPTASAPGAPATTTAHVGVMMVNTLRFLDRAAVVTAAVLQMRFGHGRTYYPVDQQLLRRSQMAGAAFVNEHI